jgi:hypothetical protein
MDQHSNNIFKLIGKLSELGIQLKKMNNIDLDESIKYELYELTNIYGFVSDLENRLAKIEAMKKQCEAYGVNYNDACSAKALPEPINENGVSEELIYGRVSNAMPEPIGVYGVSDELIRMDNYYETKEKIAMAMPDPVNSYGVSEELLYEDYIPELIYNFDSPVKE